MKLSKWSIENGGILRQKRRIWAAWLGIHVDQFDKIVRGICVPRPALMVRIYELTNGLVRPDDFYTLPDLENSAEGFL